MSEPGKAIALLRAEVGKTRALLADVDQYFREVRRDEIGGEGRSRGAGLIVAQILENSYTRLETLFLRISQFFKNSLSESRWHADLLEKMTLAIPGIRVAVLSETSYQAFAELLRFRHFKRYYFHLDFDWDRLDMLIRKYDAAYPAVLREIAAFDEFLEQLAREA